MIDGQIKPLKMRIEVRFKAFQTILQEVSNQLRNMLAALNLGGNNPKQQSPIDPVQVAAPINLAPVHYHGCPNEYDGYKIKSGIPIFNENLDMEAFGQ